MPSCHPYEVRARGSERSRRVRLGTGPGSLEKVAVFGSCFLKTRQRLCRPGRLAYVFRNALSRRLRPF